MYVILETSEIKTKSNINATNHTLYFVTYVHENVGAIQVTANEQKR